MVNPAEHCAELVRAGDRDRYLAALLAPRAARPHLLALYALDIELVSIRDKITEPLAGELRLQWWRDSVAALYHGGTGDHPVLQALAPAIAAGDLPAAAFDAMVEARITDQYDDLLPDTPALEGYLGEAFGHVVQLACLILSGGKDHRSGTTAGHAGMALGIAWILRNVARHAAHGKVYVPADMLARHAAEPDALTGGRMSPAIAAALAELRALGRTHLARAGEARATLPAQLAPAFAPLALVEPWLAASERLADPLHEAPRVSPLRRQWRLWRRS